jgi:precorrin-2 dehydrogenase/sirohydrochlorin ferrochelatase
MADAAAPALPIMLRIAGRRCVVLGGGAVAERRARSLLEAGGRVTVIAPEITDGLAALGIERQARGYARGDLAGAALVVIATGDPAINDAAAAEARREGCLINRADATEAGDFAVPAHARHGPVTIAVDIHGISAAAAAAIRRSLSASLDPAWPRLLALAGPYRQRVQQAVSDPEQRQTLLRRLTDEEAMNILKDQGETALARHLAAIATAPTRDAPEDAPDR